MELEVWIPVVVAVLTTITTLLNYFGKRKAAGALKIVIEAIEKSDKDGLVKRTVLHSPKRPEVSNLIHETVRSIGG